jgi:hypothetical protein
MSWLNGDTEEDEPLVQFRRNGSPYVDPNRLFAIPEVQEKVKQMGSALDEAEEEEETESDAR